MAPLAATHAQTSKDQPGVRWLVADEGTFWKPWQVAIGDDGASAFAGLYNNDQHYSFFAAGSPDPAFEIYPASGAFPYVFSVDVAESSSLAATLTAVQIQSPPDTQIVSTLSVYDDYGQADPDWSFEFEGSKYYSATGQGVLISRHGDVVLGWASSTELQGVQVEAFERDGTPISSALLFEWPTFVTGHLDIGLSDDGTRALFFDKIRNTVVIYDVATGTTEFSLDQNGTGHVHALSGDGQRFASGTISYFTGNSVEIWERGAGGSWSEILQLDYPYAERVWEVAIDHDGSRVAIGLQNDALESFRVVLHDVESGTTLFDHEFDAPGTALQNAVSGLCIDDAGQTVAGVAWGDSFNLTPEVFVFDAGGELLRAVDTAGSGLTVDITGDGDLVFAGCGVTHANEFGPGGNLLLIETRNMGLHVDGLPRVGNEITLRLDPSGPDDVAFIGVAQQLLDQPSGALLLDLAGPHFLLAPLGVGKSGLELRAAVPLDAALVGLMLHVQAFVVDMRSGAGEATNKVSLRFLPGDN
jgi:hypothetical protein